MGAGAILRVQRECGSARVGFVRTDLDHLPAAKQRELAEVVRLLFAEFEDATKLATSKHRREARILKVVLFGSHARGDWVDDKASGYASDYDILVIVSHQELTDVVDYWAKADDRLMREVTVSGRMKTPTNFIVHTMGEVNYQLSLGRYFFSDIVRDGIALYEAPGHEFVKPMPLTAEAARAEAQGYFGEWFPSAIDYLEQAKHAVASGRSKVAAFELHQATERLYHCALLVTTLYSPKSHKLNFLRSQAEQLEARLIEAWPRDTKASRRCFELLRRAYVEARYSPHYKITNDELAWLGARVEHLSTLVAAGCKDRLTFA